MEDNWTALAAAVKQRRKALRLSQIELAEAADVSRSTVQKLEKGENLGISRKTLGSVGRALGWAEGSVDAVLRGKPPTADQAASASPAAGGHESDAWTELADRLPASFVHELANGKVFATDVQDLTMDGALRVFTVVIRNPDQEPRSPEQVKAETEAWYRAQRELRQRPPVDTRPERSESGLE